MGRPVPRRLSAMTDVLRLFTSESVTEGHPDKVCDQISDAILDALLAQDPRSRVAVETMVTTGLVHVAGEVTTDAYVEIPQIVREVVRRIGYTSSAIGFDGDHHHRALFEHPAQELGSAATAGAVVGLSGRAGTSRASSRYQRADGHLGEVPPTDRGRRAHGRRTTE